MIFRNLSKTKFLFVLSEILLFLGLSFSVAFAVSPDPSNVTPSQGPTSGGTSITITGSNFANDDVYFLKKIGGTGTDQSQGIARDADRNVYVSGYFQGSLTFAGQVYTSSSTANGFLAKFDSLGNEIWFKPFTSTTDNSLGEMVFSSDGFLYVGGSYSGTATYDGNQVISPNGYADSLVAKLNTDGHIVWMKTITGANDDQYVTALTLDKSSTGVIFGGYFGTSITVGSLSGTSNGGPDVFIVKMDSAGTPVWLKTFGGTDTDVLQDVYTDSAGNVFATAYITGDVTISGTALTGIGGADGLLIKYGSDGTFKFAKNFGSGAGDIPDTIKVDSNGNIYISGYFNGGIGGVSYPFHIGSFTLVSNGIADGFIFKTDSAGNALWARDVGGTTTAEITDTEFDANQNLLVSGSYTSSVPFAFGSLTIPASISASRDMYFGEFDRSGNSIMVQTGGGTGLDSSRQILIDNLNRITLIGRFSNTYSMNGHTITSNGGQDAYLMEYRLTPLVKVGANYCTNVVFLSANTLTCTTPSADRSGQVPVNIENPTGEAKSALYAFLYIGSDYAWPIFTPSCGFAMPQSAPDLFQINTQLNKATIFFSPISGLQDRYFISYATNPTAEEYGVEIMNTSNGVISFDINALQPNTKYYFKVRAGNNCQPGGWSNVLSAKTGRNLSTYRVVAK